MSHYNVPFIQILFQSYFEPGPELDSLSGHIEPCSLLENKVLKVQSDNTLLLCVCVSLHEPDENLNFVLLESFFSK